MSYYRPPMGDYRTYGYGGDPGWLSKLWKVGKAVVKSFIGIPPKGVPVAAPLIAGGGIGLAAQQYMGPAAPVANLPGYGATGPAMYGTGGAAFGPPGAAADLPPRGYHLAKSGPPRWVKNRRMNVANPRALRKAMRRVQGFEKLAKRTITFTKRVRMKK